MKKFCLTLSLLLAICMTSLAQTIPALVSASQAKTYPSAQDINWVAEGGAYMAMFKIEGRSCFTRYDGSGTLQESQIGIAYLDLPKAARRKISTKYAGYKVKNATRYFKLCSSIRMDQHYEVIVIKENESYNLNFSASGKLLNKPEKTMIRQM